MAKARKRAGRVPDPTRVFPKYLQGIRDCERKAKAAVGTQQSERKKYQRLVQALAKDARRRGWRTTLQMETGGGRRGAINLSAQPERLLAASGAIHLPTWYFPDPIICATLGCKLIYVRKDGAMCVTIGCWVSGSTLACSVICFAPENPA